jgi:Flp pilus assembly protein TadB
MEPGRDPFRDFYARTAGPTRRAFSWGSGRTNPVERFLATVLVVAVLVVGLIVLIPLLVLVAAVLLIVTLYIRLRLWWAGRKKAAEADAGRENVRVIRRD